MFRKKSDFIEVLLIHPGGPFWQDKNQNTWSIPKGLVEEGEKELEGAIREFKEETGLSLKGGGEDYIEMEEVNQTGNKIIHVWAVEGDFDVSKLKSNTFLMEWPPKSGQGVRFPEVDKAEWFEVEHAKTLVVRGQISILDELVNKLAERQE